MVKSLTKLNRAINDSYLGTPGRKVPAKEAVFGQGNGGAQGHRQLHIRLGLSDTLIATVIKCDAEKLWQNPEFWDSNSIPDTGWSSWLNTILC